MAALHDGRFQPIWFCWGPFVPHPRHGNKPHKQLQPTGAEQAGIVVRQCARCGELYFCWHRGRSTGTPSTDLHILAAGEDNHAGDHHCWPTNANQTSSSNLNLPSAQSHGHLPKPITLRNVRSIHRLWWENTSEMVPVIPMILDLASVSTYPRTIITNLVLTPSS